MARATPGVQQGLLKTHDGALEIAVDTPEWFAWLAEHRVFRFAALPGNFTARRERRAAGWYWYAYRRQRGSLRSIYLGKTEELTLARLNDASSALHAIFVRDKHVADGSGRTFLLATKIARPLPRAAVVNRPRLTAYLRKHAECKLLLITGPAGSGKTTLLSEWLSSFSGQVAWVSLDEGDNDLARFWTYALAALQQAQPGLAAHVPILLSTLRDEAREPFLIPLINALATLPGEVVLVLDDYHVLTSPAVHESVSFLLENAPGQLRLVIVSRTLPPLPLIRLRARGYLAELRAADLLFTQPEAEALLTLLLERAPTAEELAGLLEYTEGWVTGLYLTILAGRDGQMAGTSPAITRGNQRELFAYLASEVLANQPEHVRDFLLRSSILDRLCAGLCDTVLQHNASCDLLQHLERENLFLSPLNEKRTWYRYHALFADFLRARLAEASPEQVALLHSRAADWHVRNALPAEAIAHALRAGNVPLAARLIEEQGRSVLMRHELVALGIWLRAFPEEELLTYPRLCILAAWVQVHTSRSEPVERYLCAAERCLGQDEEEQRMLRGEITAVRARVAIYQGQIERSVALAQQALSRLAENNYYVRGEVALSLGHAHEALGEIEAADAAYREAIELGWACGNLRAALLTVRSLAILYTGQGRLHQARKLYQAALERALEAGQEQLPPVGFMHVGLGELFHEWNDLEKAERHLREGIALGQRGGDVKIWLLGYLLLIRTTFARGASERAWTLFDEAEQLIRQAHFTRGITWLQEVRVHLGMMQGDSAPLLAWEQTCGLDATAEPDALHEAAYYRLAQALIVRNEPAHALSVLRCLLNRVEQSERTGYKITILLSMARAYERQNKINQALEVLEQALILAEPQGYIRTFLDEGAPVAALLNKSRHISARAAGSCSPGYFKRLLQAFGADPLNQQNPHKTANTLTEQLSQREMEVLQLLAAGHSNAEIAETLIIGLNTVKTHLKNIYSKLAVSTRTQAIAQARALHLL